jgi:hypothetical protein
MVNPCHGFFMRFGGNADYWGKLAWCLTALSGDHARRPHEKWGNVLKWAGLAWEQAGSLWGDAVISDEDKLPTGRVIILIGKHWRPMM